MPLWPFIIPIVVALFFVCRYFDNRFRLRRAKAMMKETFASLRNGTYKRKPALTYLTLRPDRFEIRKRTAGSCIAIAWSDITAIDAFKRDFWSHDCICVHFTLADGRSIEIDEDMDGFLELMEDATIKCPGCLAIDAWYGPIMTLAFETDLTPLYRQQSYRHHE